MAHHRQGPINYQLALWHLRKCLEQLPNERGLNWAIDALELVEWELCDYPPYGGAHTDEYRKELKKRMRHLNHPELGEERNK